MLDPDDKPFRVKVSAPGYEISYCETDRTEEHARPIPLAPNTTKDLVISLRPLKSRPR